MTDKEIKTNILAEIERLNNNLWLDDRHDQGVSDGLHAISKFINSLPEEPVSEGICNQCEAHNDKDKCDELVFGHNCPIVTNGDLDEAFEEYLIGNADKHVFGMEYRKLDMKDAFKTGWNKCINKMKQYPSIWITKIQENEWNISVKLRADMKPVSYTKSSKEEAIKFCNEYYGGYTSLKEVI